ncbi:hypothetical protein I5Q34_13075 [Streptomyces sp. AV19]|uniref:hypothetical protein n=1 Tax=Streptomyces sp. AV19 TaxID=2793068 RepID=UPI0018FEAD54|nr:hypothetical protein [Streptomyces sp. AV19]MBH1935195.1 hypothetical protein [Streptomyces sp. AV19]MDG4532024.1 hypothetical protein [Streptomyces sp. AV19]
MPASAPPPSQLPPPVPVPCTECRRIKDAFHAATREGNRTAAQGWIVAMGRHQRWMH